MQGTCKWFNAQKGYGFIIDQEGKEHFVHHSNIVMNGFRHLNEDDIVNFDLGAGKDGREQAVDVKPFLTMKMIEKSLKAENLHVKVVSANENTLPMNTLGMSKGYMVVDANDVLQTSEQGIDFLNLAAFAGFDTEGLSA